MALVHIAVSVRVSRSPRAPWAGTVLCLFGTSLISAPLALAQGSAPAPLSFESALERAMAANPDIAAARLRGPIDAAALTVARERLNPEVAVELTRETPTQAFSFAVPFELGGKRVRRGAVGEAAIRTGEAELAATVALVRSEVRRTYFDALVANARLGVVTELRDLARRTLDAAQARFDAGDAPRLEVLQARLALAAAETEVTTLEGSRRAALARLNALVAQPPHAALLLTSPLDVAGPILVDTALERARAASADLALIDRHIDEQRAKVALADAARVPDIVTTAAVTRNSQPDFSTGWRAGLAMAVPLFTRHRAGVLLEQAVLDQLSALRRATAQRIDGEVTAAATVAEAQRVAYLHYRDDILPQAQAVEALAQDSYQLGQTGIAALLQALQASREVRLRSLDTIAQFHGALADLERATGASLP